MSTALVVLGSPSAGTRRRLVAAAERLAGELVVFTGCDGEAQHMVSLWRGAPDVELLVEATASTTAENASRTLPLLRERGITEALVICAPMHLPRARGIFRRVYQQHGVAVRFRAARVVPTPGALLWELGALPVARRQVRDARNEVARR